MSDWWKSLTHKQKVALIVIIFGSAGEISIASSTSVASIDTTTQIPNGGNTIIHRDISDISTDDIHHIHNKAINIDITLEQYEQRLKKIEARIRSVLDHAHVKGRQLFELELRDLKKKLHYKTNSYE